MLPRTHGKIRALLWLTTLAALVYVIVFAYMPSDGILAPNKDAPGPPTGLHIARPVGLHRLHTLRQAMVLGNRSAKVRLPGKRSPLKDNSTSVVGGDQARRHLTLRRGCEKLGGYYPRNGSEIRLRRNLIYDENHNVVYCDMSQKRSRVIYRVLELLSSANTTHAFKTLEDPDPVIFKSFERVSFNNAHKILNDGVKIMFTQDPYTSLLYFYLRTIFVNRRRVWFGQKSDRPEYEGEKCRESLTFAEFIELFIHPDALSNGQLRLEDDKASHYWSSSFESCSPCDIRYDYIGKVENLAREIDSILSPSHYADLVDIKALVEERIQELIEPIISQATDRSPDIGQCRTHAQALLKGWAALQTMAIIPEDKQFPVDTSTTNRSVSREEFVKHVENARHSANFTVPKHPMVIMRETYGRLPRKTILKLKSLLLPDFLLFGYDPYHVLNAVPG